MLKSIFVSSLILVTTSTMSATQMKCKIDLTVISTAGLGIADTNMAWQTEIADKNVSFDDAFKGASKYLLTQKESAVFIAQKTAVAGVYSVAALALQNGKPTSSSTVLIGASEENPSQLLMLNQTSAVLNSFKQKMKSLGLKSPETFAGDSLQLDNVIDQANKISKKSLIGMPVTMTVGDCEVLK